MKNYLILSLLPATAIFANESGIITNRPSEQSAPAAPQRPIYYANEDREVCLEECREKCEPVTMVPASSRMQICDGLNLVFMGDFLYLKAEEDNLEYALQSAAPIADLVTLTQGKVHRISTDYEPGFRAGLGFLIPHDEWDLYFIWTCYRTHENASVSALPGEIIYPTMLNIFQNPQATSASSSWHLNFNTGDIEVGRSFFAGRFFTLRPFASARGAWIHQGINANYGNVLYNSTAASFTSVKAHNTSSMRAFGLRLGVDVDWELGDGWNIFFNGSGSLLWSEFNINQKETLPDGTRINQIGNHLHAVTPVMEIAGGLSWGRYLFQHRYFLKIHAGWEEQIWFAQNRFSRMMDDVNPGSLVFNSGDLSLSGLNVGATLGF